MADEVCVWRWMGMSLLLACGRPDGARDRAAYLAGDCVVIGEEWLRDDCFVFAVRADPTREDAMCPAVTSPVMRDECRFMAVDARDLVGDDAARACAAAGRYTAACHANAISREVSRLPPMDEARLTAEVEAILGRFRRPKAAAADLVRRRLASVGDGSVDGN